MTNPTQLTTFSVIVDRNGQYIAPTDTFCCDEVEVVRADEMERVLHGICDALKFLPSPKECAGTAILRGLLKGTSHAGHNDDLW